MNDFDRDMATGSKFWLGPIVQAHTIGDFQIVEYKAVEFNTPVSRRQLTGEHRFSVYIGGKSTSHSFDSLDYAILGGLEYKYDVHNSQFARFAARMLNLDGEK